MRRHVCLLLAGLTALVLMAGVMLFNTGDRVSAAPNLVTNGSFDSNVSGWALGTSSLVNTLTFDATHDLNGTLTSGSALVDDLEPANLPGSSYTETLGQCIPVTQGFIYSADGSALIPNTAGQLPGTTVDMALFFYATTDCTGSFTGNTYSALSLGVSNLWQPMSIVAAAPATSQSVVFRFNLGGGATGLQHSFGYFDGATLTQGLLATATPTTVTQTSTSTAIATQTQAPPKTHTPTATTTANVTSTPIAGLPTSSASGATATRPAGGTAPIGVRPPNTGSGPSGGHSTAIGASIATLMTAAVLMLRTGVLVATADGARRGIGSTAARL